MEFGLHLLKIGLDVTKRTLRADGAILKQLYSVTFRHYFSVLSLLRVLSFDEWLLKGTSDCFN